MIDAWDRGGHWEWASPETQAWYEQLPWDVQDPALRADAPVDRRGLVGGLVLFAVFVLGLGYSTILMLSLIGNGVSHAQAVSTQWQVFLFWPICGLFTGFLVVGMGLRARPWWKVPLITIGAVTALLMGLPGLIPLALYAAACMMGGQWIWSLVRPD